MIQVALIAMLVACGSKLPTAKIVVSGTPITVEIAATGPDRAQGLMHRDHMAADHGMLFIYPDQKPQSFWMKDTRIPLSIAFADKKGKIVKILDMTPYSKDSVKSLYPAMYALEMNQGWFATKGIEKGAMITDLPTDIEAK